MRSLDGLSERTLKDTSGDKAAGQALVKESLKISSEDQQNRVDTKAEAQQNRSTKQNDQLLQRAKEETRSTDLRNQQQRNTEARNQQEQSRRVTEVRNQQRSTEVRTQQEQSLRATEIRTQQEQRQSEVRNQQEQSRRATEIRTQQQEQRAAEIRTQEQRRATETKSQQAPGLLSDFGGNWQKDDAGNFVTRSTDGKLLTRNADGKLVDYTSHLNQKHMASQDQMAFASILFCNPLMLLGMGATLAVIDQAHGAKTQKMSDNLHQKFDGKQANTRAAQNSYSSEISRKAMLIAQYTRPLDGRELITQPGAKSIQDAAQQEESRRREIKRKKTEEVSNRAPIKLSMPADKYALNAKKLIKTKRLLEEHIEKVRGQASLEEMSRLYAQVEVLDKALKRMANF